MSFFSSVKDMEFILASGSAVRQKMLRNAGFDFEICSADIDERSIQKDLESQDCSVAQIALALGIEKARFVAAKFPDKYVIGSDQMLVFEDHILNKSASLSQAKDKLLKLSGNTHHLISSAAIVKNDEVIWSHTDKADLVMRDLSERDIDDYLDKAGSDVLTSVGAYKLEEYGAWLFEKIEGDFFTILGFPLLPFLGFVKNS